MLLEFTFKNHRSFKDEYTLSLIATSLKSRARRVDNDNVFQFRKLRVLRTAAILGPNAGGKSNVASAFRKMKAIVNTSVQRAEEQTDLPVEPFLLDVAARIAPTTFEVSFVADQRQYRYGFTITSERILSEWLFYTPRSAETVIFERSGDDLKTGKEFREVTDLIKRVDEKALVLTLASALKIKPAPAITSWFRNLSIISGDDDDTHRAFTLKCLKEGRHREEIEDLLRKLDLHIQDIKVEFTEQEEILQFLNQGEVPLAISDEFKTGFAERMSLQMSDVLTAHRVFQNKEPVEDIWLNLRAHESKGTQKIFAIAGPLSDTLAQGRTLVLDELDARLHPLLSHAIVRLFNNPATNPLNAQLIFTTHDPSFLDYRTLRRDQIWIVDKDALERSRLFSLAEIRVRQDASFEQDYLAGKYGGVPFIDDSVLAGGAESDTPSDTDLLGVERGGNG